MCTSNPGEKLDSEYDPGSEDWRITLKVFNGDHEERRVLAFVGHSQVSPAEDRDLTADELDEDKGKDVTSCVDFNGKFLETEQSNIDEFSIKSISEFKIYLGKHPEGEKTPKGKKSRRSGSKQALALRIATPLQGKEKPLYGQIVASRRRSLNLDLSPEVCHFYLHTK